MPDSTVRVLHIGWAYRPLRSGGLIVYAGDLMRMEQERGITVAYFAAGRIHPGNQAPRLAKWQQDEIHIFEIIDPPIMHAGDRGTYPPELELSESKSEQFFREVLDTFKPQIIHIHELAGLPFTLIDIAAHQYQIPLIMTLHNYFMLCPTLNLFTQEKTICELDDPGGYCSACFSECSDFRDDFIESTLAWEGRRLHRWIYHMGRRLRKIIRKSVPLPQSLPDQGVSIFTSRRQENIRRLRTMDLLVAQSRRVAEIYQQYTGREDIEVLHSSPRHLVMIRPRAMTNVPKRVCFATLNGCVSPFKGAEIVAEAVDILHRQELGERFLLQVWGGVHESVRQRLMVAPDVVCCGAYPLEQLDNLLNNIDVGLVPSLCEETYGYVGIEFLTKGIPVIGNRRGGISDYTMEGQSGWLNEPCTAEGLAEIMARIIRTPEIILPLNQWILANRESLISDMERHVDTIVQYYQKIIKSPGALPT